MTQETTTLIRPSGTAGVADGLDANFEGLAYAVDGGIGVRAALGLLVLETDQTVEWEFRHLLPAHGVALYEARLHNDAVITPDSLKAMERELAPATRLLPPAVDLAAIGYACTSGSMIMGADVVSRHIGAVRPAAKVSNPVVAALAAFRALNVSKVALLTPYLATINMSLRANFQRLGLSIPVMGSFNEADDNVVARISTASIRDAILKIGQSKACDGVFVSCTSLRVAEIVAGVEAELGKPVTSSNHALAWHMLRLAGIDDAMPQHGRLFTRGLAPLAERAA
jgi:maleate isomerase